MENNIQAFTNEDFGTIRTSTLNGKPAFVAADACKALELKDTSMAVNRLGDDEKGTSIIGTLGGNQKMLVVTEEGLYELVFQSRKPNAKAFKRWIKHEVLPKIREYGAYISPAAEITPEFLRNIADALEAEKRKVAQLEETVAVQTAQIAELQPKASYYDVVLNCKDLVAISKIAKDYGMDAVKMNKLLHELGVQFKQGKTWLLYAKYAGLGRTSTKTQTYNGSDGEVHSKVHTYWSRMGNRMLDKKIKTFIITVGR